MPKSLSPRYGLTRWSTDDDIWTRAEIDANFGALEDRTLAGRTGLAAERDVPARDRELFIASDTGAVSIGRLAGGGWSELARLGAVSTFTAAVTAASLTASADGAVTGVVVPKTYPNGAAATAAIGAPVIGSVIWLSAPTTPGAVPGLFQFQATGWNPVRLPRRGARAVTNAATPVAASALTTINNGGAAAWTAGEDSGGFVSPIAGTTTPIIIPAGLDGLYFVGADSGYGTIVGARAFTQVIVNGVLAHNCRSVWSTDGTATVSAPMPLRAGDTIGMQVFNSTAQNVLVGSEVFCYRIGD